MKKVKIYAIAVLSIFAVTSCDWWDLDNYDGPNAQIYGTIKDATGKLIPQQLNNGSQIEYVEEYGNGENWATQTMTFMSDGNYRNNIFFAGTYRYILPKRGNFYPAANATYGFDTLKNYVIKEGENELNFTVTPYAKIIPADGTTAVIRYNPNAGTAPGGQVIARFKVVKTDPTATLTNVGLFVHGTKTVAANGASLYLVEKNISTGTDADGNPAQSQETVWELVMDVRSSGTPRLVAGINFYFRVGALITGTDSRHNYYEEEFEFRME